jgi:hypothetical protein
MELAPLAAALNTVLAGLPFTVTEELDPGAVLSYSPTLGQISG